MNLAAAWRALWARNPARPAANPVAEAIGINIDPDEDQWRPLTGRTRRDLTPVDQDRMRETAAWLWEGNLLANRLIELPGAFLLAEGVELTCPGDQAHQQLLDRFWRDPVNRMNLALPEFVRELALYGEQCYPAFFAEDGLLRLGYLDPGLIEDVLTDPDNPRMPIGIKTVADKDGRHYVYRTLIAAPESVFTQATQRLRAQMADGECFYFRVNALASGKRGRSDLLAAADWCDQYEQFMFGTAEYVTALRSFFWDVTLHNATQDQVEARARQMAPPKPGSVRVHNDSEEWKTQTPDLKAVDTESIARTFRNHILGGQTLPEHWYGGGGEVNRAVGAEMLEPTNKILAMRQRVWKHILEEIGQVILFRAEGGPPELDWSDPKWAVEAVFPEILSRDVTKYAAALGQAVAGCAQAVSEGRMSEPTAARIVAVIAARLGVEYDPEDDLAAAQAEHAARAERDTFRDPPPDPDDDGGAPADPNPPPNPSPAETE